MFLLSGVARYLFVPLAEAVVFAMLTSYVLSRTLVPTLAKYWLRTAEQEHAAAANPNAWQRFQRGFEARFERLRDTLSAVLDDVLRAPRACSSRCSWASPSPRCCSIPFLGSNFFPEVDAGQIKLHIRGPTGMRVEDTAALVDHVEAALREVIPPNEIASVVDNVGLPVSSINLTYGNSGTDRQQRCRYSHLADSRSRADRGLRARRCASGCRSEFPGTELRASCRRTS